MSSSHQRLWLAAFIGICFLACTEDSLVDNPDNAQGSQDSVAFEFRFYPQFGDKPMKLGEKFVNAAGDTTWLTLAQFYASEFCFVDTLGISHASPGLDLVDFSNSESENRGYYAIHTQAVPGVYSGIKFTVGIPYGLNHMDAAEQAFPLGPNSEMFWSWNSGYIFNRVEGKADSSGKPVSFFYHIGGDNRKQTVSLYTLPDPMMTAMGMPPRTSKMEVKADGSGVFSLTVDYSSIFSTGLDGSGPLNAVSDTLERTAHGGPLADRIFLNMQAMFKKKG